MQRSFLGLVLLCCLIPAACMASTTITLSAMANIFGAGGTLPTPPSGGAGILPVDYAITPSPYLVLYFPSVTGSVNCCGGSAYVTGADGVTGPNSTNITSVNGISSISKTNRIMFVVGVFTDDHGTGSYLTAAQNNYDNADNTVNFHPAVGQTFFIGDGLTTGGVRQNFYVPTGATHLYLGFADGWLFNGAPSWYQDNTGSLRMTIDHWDAGPEAPEPATIGLAGLGLAGLIYCARRKKTA